MLLNLLQRSRDLCGSVQWAIPFEINAPCRIFTVILPQGLPDFEWNIKLAVIFMFTIVIPKEMK